MQLERILHSQGFGSRKECRALIRAGRVGVAGLEVTDPFIEFPLRELEFSVDGQPWRFRERVYLMLDKPVGHECSRAPRHHPSVFDLLPDPLRRREAQAVGRLDEDTSGLLLFSDDGAFIHALISPKRKVPKRYRVTCRHPVDDAQIAALLEGVQLRDEATPVAALACARIDACQIELALGEGKYHQVKRMLAAVGNRVESLRRIAIGELYLDESLGPGGWRYLEMEDLARLGYGGG